MINAWLRSASTIAKQTPYSRLAQSFQYEWPNIFQEPKGPQSVWSRLSALCRAEITHMFPAGDSPSEMEVPSHALHFPEDPGQRAWFGWYLEGMKGDVCSLINLNYSFCFMEPYIQLVPIQHLSVAKSKDRGRKKPNSSCLTLGSNCCRE